MYINTMRDLEVFYKGFPEFKEETQELISLDFLNTPGCLYTTGVNGIAKAHFMTSTGKVLCNPTQAMVLLSKAYSLDRTEKTINSKSTPDEIRKEFVRNYDKIKRTLWPKNNDASIIKDGFYRRLFGNVVTNDTFRNVDNSKLNKRIFDIEIIQHFECVNQQIGGKYNEEQIRQINDSLYRDIVEEKTHGLFGLTDLTLCIVEEQVAKELKDDYGWKFSHREYNLYSIDWEIIHGIEAAFPSIKDAVTAAADMVFKEVPDGYRYATAWEGNLSVGIEDSNPISKTTVYKRMKEKHLNRIYELIGFNKENFREYIESIANTPKLSMFIEKILVDYLIPLCKNFVQEVDSLRNLMRANEDTDKIAKQLATYVYFKMNNVSVM